MLTLPDNPVLSFKGGLTFSAWLKIFSAQDNAYLLFRESENHSFSLGIQDAHVIVHVRDGDQIFENGTTTSIPLEGWHHLAVTVSPEGRVTLFVDGAESEWMDIQTDLAAMAGKLFIGADASGSHSFSGDMDEIRLSAIVRPPEWIRADYASQGPESRLCSFGLEDVGEGSGSGMPVFYLGTIFKNITLDGLVVIIMLLVLSGCSWIVMVSKGIFLHNTIKGDKQFLSQYQAVSDPLELSKNAMSFNGSGFYRIYEAGCKALDAFRPPSVDDHPAAGNLVADNPTADTPTGNNPNKQTISTKAIENFKAVLEKGLVDESKRLNAGLIVLTMSISGGPFLGLLGTVWGVMNTFAAMAEAGEANIMAIAPGVASALSTTVFGLIVAIPALFGYNFLPEKYGTLPQTPAYLSISSALRSMRSTGETNETQSLYPGKIRRH